MKQMLTDEELEDPEDAVEVAIEVAVDVEDDVFVVEVLALVVDALAVVLVDEVFAVDEVVVEVWVTWPFAPLAPIAPLPPFPPFPPLPPCLPPACLTAFSDVRSATLEVVAAITVSEDDVETGVDTS